MPVSLNISFSNKKNLISNLFEILKDADFCGQEPAVYSRLQKLLDSLKDDVWFVLESPYVDRHYRDTYYSYYSSRFKKIGRDCIRVNIFHEMTKLPIKKYHAQLKKICYIWLCRVLFGFVNCTGCRTLLKMTDTVQVY